MGLDGVELIIATEESFGISIADEEAEKVVTVDDLYQLILAKVTPATRNKCISASAFYNLRGIIAAKLGIDRKTILKDTKLDEIIPKEDRRSFWDYIAKEAGVVLPSLTRNSFLNRALVFIPVLSLLFAGLGLAIDDINSVIAVIAGGTGIALTYLLASLTEPLKVHFEDIYITMEDLVKNVVANNFSTLTSGSEEWSKADLYQSYIQIVSEQLGIAKNEIQGHHKFVDDLGVD